jgi:serine/threonine-protein phosphatase 4 regulatory subunit 2
MSRLEWVADYDDILDRIASTDVVNSDWTKLRDMIKYKIDKNVSMFLSEAEQPPPTPRPFSPQPLASGGLKLPPFPPRKRNETNVNESPISYMNEEQATEMKNFVFALLHGFDEYPPFTIQRVCELSLRPKQNYNSVGKYLRAVEKSLLVTSTMDAFPPLSEKDRESSLKLCISMGTPQTAPTTPLFSPIPFLHDDARRSKSRSPPPSPLALSSTIGVPTVGFTGKALGLVDELDDPSPGHMSDHPTALTSVTTAGPRPFLGSLEQRFVKASEGAEATQGTSNGMVLDDTDDKENKG